MSNVWECKPSEQEIEMVQKFWGTANRLRLKKSIIGKAGINLCPKVEKAIFFALASMRLYNLLPMNKSEDERIKTVLDVVKRYKGKISKIDDIQRLLREIYYAFVEVESTTGTEEFTHLEKCLKGTSIMGKIKKAGRAVDKAVTPQKLLDARKVLAQQIEEVGEKINEYFNQRGGKGQSPLDEQMIGYKEQIDALRSKKSKGDSLNLKDDIDVNSFYKTKTIDEARILLSKVYGVINGRLQLEEKTRENLEKYISENKEKLENYFNAFKSDINNLDSGGKNHLRILNVLLGKGSSCDLPLNIDLNTILDNVNYTYGNMLQKLQKAVAYVDVRFGKTPVDKLKELLPSLTNTQKYLDAVYNTYKSEGDMLDNGIYPILQKVASGLGVSVTDIKNISKDIDAYKVRGDQVSEVYEGLSQLETLASGRLELISLIETNYNNLVKYFGFIKPNSKTEKNYIKTLNRNALATRLAKAKKPSETKLSDAVKNNKNQFIIRYLSSCEDDIFGKTKFVIEANNYANKNGDKLKQKGKDSAALWEAGVTLKNRLSTLGNLEDAQKYLDKVYEYSNEGEMLDRHTGILLDQIASVLGKKSNEIKNISNDIDFGKLKDKTLKDKVFDNLKELEGCAGPRLELIKLIEDNHKKLVDYYGSGEHKSEEDGKYRSYLNALVLFYGMGNRWDGDSEKLDDTLKDMAQFVNGYLSSGVEDTKTKITIIQGAIAHANGKH